MEVFLMKTYRVEDKPISVSGGMVELTKKQSKSRMHNLESAKGEDGKIIEGRFKVINPIQFKSGEIFRFDGEIGKIQSALVEPVDDKLFDKKIDSEIEKALIQEEEGKKADKAEAKRQKAVKQAKVDKLEKELSEAKE